MNSSTKKSSSEFNLIVFQISCVVILVVAAITIKFIGGSFYEDVRNWYVENFEDETKVSEVVPERQREAIKADAVIDIETVIQEPAITVNNSLPVINTVISSKKEINYEYNSLQMPLKKYSITSKFGYRNNPINGRYEFHKGLDMAADKGTGICSVSAGKVILVKNSPSYGKYIKVDHGGGLQTLYAHCNSIIKKEGDTVKQGEAIATVGNTGQSTGNHLHFEIILNGKYQNPEWLLSR